MNIKLLSACAGASLAAGTALAQWQPDVRLTADPSFSSTTFGNARSITAARNALYVVWFDERDGNQEVYFKRSVDGGTNWSGDTRLTQDGAISKFPSVAADGATVHVAWEEYRDGNAEIYYKRSLDAGVTWGADVRLTSNAATSLSPCITAVNDVMNVIWFDARSGNHDVFAKRSADGGTTWGGDLRLTVNAAASVYPSAAAWGHDVHVAWEEYRDGANGEIYYKRSSDRGLTWGPDIRLTTNAARSLSPSIAAEAGRVHVVWFDTRDGNSEIYEKHSADGGLAWSADTRLTSEPANSEFPCVAVSSSNVHVTWIDERNGNLEIYYKKSSTGGATWEPDVQLTTNQWRGTDPSIAVAGPAVHVVWTDSRDGNANGQPYNGNYEVYYKQQPAGNRNFGGIAPAAAVEATAIIDP